GTELVLTAEGGERPTTLSRYPDLDNETRLQPVDRPSRIVAIFLDLRAGLPESGARTFSSKVCATSRGLPIRRRLAFSDSLLGISQAMDAWRYWLTHVAFAAALLWLAWLASLERTWRPRGRRRLLLLTLPFLGLLALF